MRFPAFFPDIAFIQPVVWQFNLIAINELLLKQAVLVANPVPITGIAITGQCVHKR